MEQPNPSPELEPADPKRCQAEVIAYRPFVMGGNVYERVRCENKPHWIATEVVPRDTDGLCGSMSLCDQCALIFINKKTLPPDHYTLEWIGTNGLIEKHEGYVPPPTNRSIADEDDCYPD